MTDQYITEPTSVFYLINPANHRNPSFSLVVEKQFVDPSNFYKIKEEIESQPGFVRWMDNYYVDELYHWYIKSKNQLDKK
jgi:hypothetical protein